MWVIKYNVVNVQIIWLIFLFFLQKGVFILLTSFLFGAQYFRKDEHNVYWIMHKFVLNCPSSRITLIALRFGNILYQSRFFTLIISSKKCWPNIFTYYALIIPASLLSLSWKRVRLRCLHRRCNILWNAISFLSTNIINSVY